jgi:UBA-like protein
MSTAIDLSSLTPEQQSALEQYTAVTNQQIEDAIPLLNRTQWNVQVRFTASRDILFLTTSADRDRKIL